MSLAPPASLTIGLSPGEFRRASLWLDELGQTCRIPDEPLYGLDLCLNEALANVLSHGGLDPAKATVELSLEMSRQPGRASATLRLRDAGIAFDPLSHIPKPIAESLDEAEPGGRGIALMRLYASEIGYRRRDGHNHLSFGVRWDET